MELAENKDFWRTPSVAFLKSLASRICWPVVGSKLCWYHPLLIVLRKIKLQEELHICYRSLIAIISSSRVEGYGCNDERIDNWQIRELCLFPECGCIWMSIRLTKAGLLVGLLIGATDSGPDARWMQHDRWSLLVWLVGAMVGHHIETLRRSVWRPYVDLV
jgi:hypothetical protein